MSFGLKNTDATYQRAIQKCLASQLPRNVEAYVNDRVLKTKDPNNVIPDLTETFDNLRKIRWKLSPTKCVFGVPSGKLLGFIVSSRGVEANPIKISAITDMEPLKTAKDVQKLTGCMAALNIFISKLGECGMEFFKLLKKQDRFVWIDSAQVAFEDIKKFLTMPPILTLPLLDEDLLLYISATTNMVSTTIVVECAKEGHLQKVQ